MEDNLREIVHQAATDLFGQPPQQLDLTQFMKVCQYVDGALGESALKQMFTILNKEGHVPLERVVSLLATIQEEEEKREQPQVHPANQISLEKLQQLKIIFDSVSRDHKMAMKDLSICKQFYCILDLDAHQNQLLISRQDIISIFTSLLYDETVTEDKFSSFICEAESLLYQPYQREPDPPMEYQLQSQHPGQDQHRLEAEQEHELSFQATMQLLTTLINQAKSRGDSLAVDICYQLESAMSQMDSAISQHQQQMDQQIQNGKLQQLQAQGYEKQIRILEQAHAELSYQLHDQQQDQGHLQKDYKVLQEKYERQVDRHKELVIQKQEQTDKTKAQQREDQETLKEQQKFIQKLKKHISLIEQEKKVIIEHETEQEIYKQGLEEEIQQQAQQMQQVVKQKEERQREEVENIQQQVQQMEKYNEQLQQEKGELVVRLDVLEEKRQFCVANHQQNALNQSIAMSQGIQMKYKDILEMSTSIADVKHVNPLLLSQLSALSAYKPPSIQNSQVLKNSNMLSSAVGIKRQLRQGRARTFKIVKGDTPADLHSIDDIERIQKEKGRSVSTRSRAMKGLTQINEEYEDKMAQSQEIVLPKYMEKAVQTEQINENIKETLKVDSGVIEGRVAEHEEQVNNRIIQLLTGCDQSQSSEEDMVMKEEQDDQENLLKEEEEKQKERQKMLEQAMQADKEEQEKEEQVLQFELQQENIEGVQLTEAQQIRRQIKRNLMEKKKAKRQINYLWVFKEEQNRWIKMYDQNDLQEEEEEEDQMRVSQMTGHLNDQVLQALQQNEENPQKKEQWFVDTLIGSSLKVVATQSHVYLLSQKGETVFNLSLSDLTQLLISKSQNEVCVLRYGQAQDQLIQVASRAQFVMHLMQVQQEEANVEFSTRHIYRVNVPK